MSGDRGGALRPFCAASLFLVALTAGAAASDVPNMLGVWTRTANSSARVSRTPGDPASAKASLVNSSGDGWKVSIDAQDGRAFSGKMIDSAGQSYFFVGAFGDDDHFVFATDKDTGWGEIDDSDGMKYCWSTASPGFVGAGCARFARSK